MFIYIFRTNKKMTNIKKLFLKYIFKLDKVGDTNERK